jgi:hypothetical protein
MSEEAADKWDKDVLDRKPAGDFLYRLTLQRFDAYHSGVGGGALCLALDADWGAGKTFFVDRWSNDIGASKHPVIHFDAWANDLSDDPLLGFMSQLQTSLEPWLKSLPAIPKVKKEAITRFKKVLKAAPRAVIPVLGVVAKGALFKLAGMNAEEIVEAASTGEIELDADEIKSMSNEGLEKFFELAVKSHSDKQSAIKGMKQAIEDLLSYLGEQADVKLPMFVFVDELDRCRPDYAIRLLEGIKHLFDAQGICFVFSTNLLQLAASAQAVYGPNFDAYRYLKRFFAFEYRLAEPDHRAYANLLVGESVLAKRKLKFCSSLPEPAPDAVAALASDFSLVSKAFRLDLRSQKQVLRLAEAACSGLEDGSNLYCSYMFVLAAAFQKGAGTFDSMRNGFPATLDKLIVDPIDIPFKRWDENGRPQAKSISFRELVVIYHSLASKTAEELSKLASNMNTQEYPESLKWFVIGEFNHGLVRRVGALPSLARYYNLVRAGGQTGLTERETP